MFAPTNVGAAWSPDQRQTLVAWTNNDAAVDAYIISRSDDRGEFVVLDAALPPTAVNYIDDQAIENDREYQYKVYGVLLGVDGPAGYSNILEPRAIDVYPEVSGLSGFNFWVEWRGPFDPVDDGFRFMVLSPEQVLDPDYPQSPVPEEEVERWQR